jgi:hypothetical protein
MSDEKALATNSQLVALASVLLQRSQIAGTLGLTFDGNRDMYAALGYKKDLKFADFLGAYDRQDIAARVVDLPAIDSWRYPPKFSDANSDETDFLKDWKDIANRLPVWRTLKQLDRVTGIGRYGCLLLGVKGKGSLETEVGENTLTSPEDLIYLRALTEDKATIKEWEDSTNSPRYGLPLMYQVEVGTGDNTKTANVHWSRIIHVAEDSLDTGVFGTPRLQRIFNRLADLEKIVGGGSEATWQVMDRGLHADMRDGFTMGPTDEDTLSDEIEEYLHGRRRVVRTAGVDLQQLGSDVVDPTGLFNIIISLVAAAANIPQRILIGSERGELASSQDAATWAGVVLSRQANFVEPVIVRPLVDRLIKFGVIRPPKDERYKVAWRSLLAHDDQKQANVAQGKALALVSYAGEFEAQQIVPPAEFREKWLDLPPEIPKQYKESIPEAPALMPPALITEAPGTPNGAKPSGDGNNGGGDKTKLPKADNKLN